MEFDLRAREVVSPLRASRTSRIRPARSRDQIEQVREAENSLFGEGMGSASRTLPSLKQRTE
jgi:hypothetical protein